MLGPVSWTELLRFVDDGVIEGGDPILNPRTHRWRPARLVPSLMGEGQRKEPPITSQVQNRSPSASSRRPLTHDARNTDSKSTTLSQEPVQSTKPDNESSAASWMRHATYWYYGAGWDILLGVHDALKKQHPKLLGAIYMSFGLLVAAALLYGWLSPPSAVPTTPATKAEPKPTNPVPVQVTFRYSAIGKGLVMRLFSLKKNGEPILVTVHVKGTVLSTSKIVDVRSDYPTDLGWAELDNFVIQPGHTVVLEARDYDRVVLQAQPTRR